MKYAGCQKIFLPFKTVVKWKPGIVYSKDFYTKFNKVVYLATYSEGKQDT